MARFVIGIGLRRIAIHERAPVHRIGLAAGLMFDREQHFASIAIDQVLKTVLVFVAFLCDQAEFEEPAMRAGKIGRVDLHVVPVERTLGRVRLAEIKVLLFAHLHPRFRADAVLDDIRGSVEHLAVKPRNARRSPGPPT